MSIDQEFTATAIRNYCGEMQEMQVKIIGESYARAKFEFNIRHIDWYIK